MSALYDHGLELQVLATLAETSALDIAEARGVAERSRLTADDFHNELYRRVWTAQMQLLFDGQACEFGRLGPRLNGEDRQKLPTLLAGRSLGVSHAVMGAADDLRGMSLRRGIMRFGREIAAQAENSTDPSVLLTNAAALLARITTSRSANWRTLKEVLEQVRVEMKAVASGVGAVVLPTGIPEWDRIIGGLWPTLNVIGAHPGHGKSGLIGRMALNIALSGKKVAIFSLEDQATWLAYRALSHESGISQFVLRNRALTADQDYSVHGGELAMGAYAENIMIDDRGALAPGELVQAARDAILNKGAKAVVVDHLGEIRHGEGDRHDLMIAESLSDIRGLAKGYGVPVLMAAHLKPGAVYPFTQHDFRNAFAIEAMARVLVAWEKDKEELKMLTLKNQFGIAPASFKLPFHGPSAMVTNEGEQAPVTQGALL